MILYTLYYVKKTKAKMCGSCSQVHNLPMKEMKHFVASYDTILLFIFMLLLKINFEASWVGFILATLKVCFP